MKSFPFAVIAALVISVALMGSAHADQRIESAVQAELDRSGTARVTIVFELGQAQAAPSRQARQAEIQRVAGEIVSAAGAGFELQRQFNLVSAVVGTLDQPTLDRILSLDSVTSVGLDPGGSGHVDVARALMGIDTVQAPPPVGFGLTGENVKVVVMDSGIDSDNVDFTGALVDEACFCFDGGAGCCPSGATTQFGLGSAEDDHNHGTWVSGHILSRGNDAPRGAAPAASLVAVKVLDSNNSFCCASDVTAAYDWVATNHPDAAVLNASLGTGALFDSECSSATSWLIAMSQATAAVEANGTFMTASSGNSASATSIGAPSCIAEVMAVGATYKQNYSVPSCPPSQVDDIACYSNVSTELEVLAPGSFMTTTARGGGVATNLQGTSFASPMVAGCVALIKAARPEATIEEIRADLKASDAQILDTRIGLTFPRVDCLSAVRGLLQDRFETP